MPLKKLAKLYKEQFIFSRSIIVISASMIANAFSYLFQLLSGRYFSPSDYGTLVALFSLSGIIPLVSMFFTNGIPKLVSEIKDEDYPKRISYLYFSILKIISVISIFALLIMIVGINFISSFLNINNKILIITFSIAVSAGMVTSFMAPFLQGLHRFKAFSFTTILGSLLKFGVILIVILLSLRLNYVFAGLVISTVLVGIASHLILRKNIFIKYNKFHQKDIKTLLKYSTGGAFALIGLTLLQNMDVVLVKHFFTEDISGIYGSLSVIGRIVFYLASPVAIVMLPICAEKFKKGENYKKPFFTAFLLSFLIATVVTIIYWAFPHLVIKLLFGSKYLPAEPYLPLFAIFMLLNSLLTLFAWFFIAISKFKLAGLTLLAAGLQYLGIQFFHADLYEILWVSIISITVPLAIMSYPVFIESRN